MSNTVIQLKHSTISGNTPSSLANGEIAINNYDGKFFYRDPSGIIQTIQRYTGPAGLNQEIQFNDNGILGANSSLSFDKSTGNLTVGGVITGTGSITGGSVISTSYIQFGDGSKQYTANAGTGGGGVSSVGDATGAISNTQLISFVTSAFANATFGQAAFDKANSANVLAQAAYDNSNNDVTSISISAGTFGNSSIVPVFHIESNGRISSIANSTISIDAAQIASGTIASDRLSGSYTGITGVDTLTIGTWQANSISTTYTDAKITSVGTNTGAISNTQLLDFVKAVDGTGSGLDADLLDGLNSTSFANSTFTQAAFDKANTSGTTITNDASSSTSRYILLTTQTSGSLTIANTSLDGLYYTPSTGTFNANNFNSLSDGRFKENIQTIDNSNDILKKIRGVSFNWKNTGKKSFGVIAQELEMILPELVEINDSKIRTVNYNALIPFLIEAIKKQQEEIDAIKKLLK